MAKRSTKVALTYAVTLIITLAVFGGLGYYFTNLILDGGLGRKVEETPETTPPSYNEYTPQDSDRKTMLLIADFENRSSGSCFILLRHIPEERQIIMLTLPSDTFASASGSENSIYEFYRTEGVLTAVEAAENALDIKIDKYLKLNKTSFITLADIFHGVEYNVPYNLVYENPDGEDIIFKEGPVYLNSENLVKVFSFPLFSSGEEYRAKTITIIASDLINKNVVSGFAGNIDDYFSIVINSEIETDITSYDYDEYSEALKYTASNPDRIVKYVFVSGSYDDYGRFVLDENFIRSLSEW